MAQRALVFAVLLAAASFARAQTTSADMGGAWAGQYAITDHCDNGTTFGSRGIATASFSQSGSSVAGSIALHNVIFSRGGQDCADLANPETITVVIEGTVTGNSFTGLLHPLTPGPVPINGLIGSNSLTLSFPRHPVTSGTFTLTRAQPTNANMGGAWAGQYAITDHCDNGTTFSSNGIATASFSQTGSSVIGSIALYNVIFSRGGQDCAVLANPATITVSIEGTVVGNSFTGLLHPSGGPVPITGSIDSHSLTLSFPQHPVTSGTFTMARSPFVSADGQITGWWSGSVNETFFWGEGSPKSCANGTPAPFSTSGQSTLAIAQNGSNFAGSMTLPHRWSAHRNSDNGQCMWVDGGSYSFAVSGTVSGSIINIYASDSAFTSTLSVSGSTITGNFQADTESASFTLIKALPAEGDITGWWSGLINEAFFWDASSPQSCTNGTPGSFTTRGQATLAIAQNGSNFAGSMTLPHRWSDHRNPDNGQCMWVYGGSHLFAVSGTISGSTINLQPLDSSFSSTLSVSRSTITGAFEADTESASFTLLKHSFAPSRRRAVRH